MIDTGEGPDLTTTALSTNLFFDPPFASLLAGENNTAFAGNNNKLAGVNLGGVLNWSFSGPGSTPQFFGAAFLSASLDQGRLFGFDSTDDLIFDSAGITTVATSTVGDWEPGLAQRASPDGGTEEVVTPLSPQVAAVSWTFIGGNERGDYAPSLPQIDKLSKSRDLVGTGPWIVQLQGTLLKQVVSVDAGKGIVVTISGFDLASATNTSFGTTFTIAADAPPGAHKVVATLKNGKKITSRQDFFVQIPKSLVGTAFAGTFEDIPASGAGPLHTPNPGDVRLPDGTPHESNVFGVYRNYAFQVMDQDSPAQPIRPDETVLHFTELLSNYDPPCTPVLIQRGQCITSRTVNTNNAGQVFDIHGLFLPDAPLDPDLHLSITQGFTVTLGEQIFQLTTIFRISVGKFNGTAKESITTVHQ